MRIPSVCYDYVVKRRVTLAEAGEADLDDHLVALREGWKWNDLVLVPGCTLGNSRRICRDSIVLYNYFIECP